MNDKIPGTCASLVRKRSMTRCVLKPSRSFDGLRLKNSVPRLFAPKNEAPPTPEPTSMTAGSLPMISATRRCSSTMVLNETSGEARVPPNTRPVSSWGIWPFGIL